MESPPPLDLDDLSLADAVARSWHLDAGQLRYIPKGFGSYHWLAETPTHQYFLTVDDLNSKPWLGASPDSTFEGLEAAYDSAVALHRQANLSFVVAPIPQHHGGTALRLSERYALTVFPFMAGEPGVWGNPIGQKDRRQLLRQLAELHRSTPAAASALRHGLALPGRAGLESALDDLDRPWQGGPFSDLARRELANHAATVHEWLTAFDHLAGLVEEAGGEQVITHGEPHPGNLVRAEDGVLLVDWDTVGLAPPERDLWMFDDGSPNILAPYTETSGRLVDAAAIRLFRLAWTLSEIVAFTALFRSHHERNRDTEKSWRALTESLLGVPASGPYGPALQAGSE
ncbi:MAG: aminoglycoside phosphotransferase family protein [Acidimicrobiales bacterium]